MFGKTLRGNGRNVSGLKPIPDSPFCPVTNLRFYVALAEKMSIDLRAGFLFLMTNHHGNVTVSHFVGSAVANRVKKNLDDLRINDGETVHSFRSGCSITLSLLGISYEQVVAKHVGWKSLDMAVYYTQFDKVMAIDDASSVVAHASQGSSKDTSDAEMLGKYFRARNFLNGFKPLFA